MVNQFVLEICYVLDISAGSQKHKYQCHHCGQTKGPFAVKFHNVQYVLLNVALKRANLLIFMEIQCKDVKKRLIL